LVLQNVKYWPHFNYEKADHHDLFKDRRAP